MAENGNDIVERLNCLHVWPQSAADTHADVMGPRMIAGLYAVGNVAERALAHITTLEAQLAEAREALARRDGFVMEAVVLLDNANGISDDARYNYVGRATAHLLAARPQNGEA